MRAAAPGTPWSAAGTAAPSPPWPCPGGAGTASAPAAARAPPSPALSRPAPSSAHRVSGAHTLKGASFPRPRPPGPPCKVTPAPPSSCSDTCSPAGGARCCLLRPSGSPACAAGRRGRGYGRKGPAQGRGPLATPCPQATGAEPVSTGSGGLDRRWRPSRRRDWWAGRPGCVFTGDRAWLPTHVQGVPEAAVLTCVGAGAASLHPTRGWVLSLCLCRGHRAPRG